MSAALDLFNFSSQQRTASSSSSSRKHGGGGGYSNVDSQPAVVEGTASHGGVRVPFASRSSSSSLRCGASNTNSMKQQHRSSNKSSASIATASTTGSSTDQENVMIEEKRRRAHGGEGYTTHQYLRGKLLGKGGFAKVYLCTAMDTSKQYAVKIVPKANLVKARARQKLQTEIKIHRTLKHPYVCEYKHFFEDRTNCYILLELCHNQSLNEMIKRRKRLTEPEAALFMTQLLSAVRYLHDKNVIHRDLKLGNLFLDRNLGVKVGDLGLATILDDPEEKRKTICGTPNYIAPEVIQGDKAKRGHSFEVDVWSMGVILYTILVGKPPYEAKDVKATYQRILANEYSFPSNNSSKHVDLSSAAKDLIRRMLRSSPADRPSLDDIQAHPFLSDRYVPASIPTSATHTAPKWRMDSDGELVAVVEESSSSRTSSSSLRKPLVPRGRLPFTSHDSNNNINVASNKSDQKQQTKKKSEIDMQRIVKTAATCMTNNNNKKPAATATTTRGGFTIFDDTEKESTTHRSGNTNLDDEGDLTRRTRIMTISGGASASSPTRSVRSAAVSVARSSAASVSSLQTSSDKDMEILLRLSNHIDTVLDVTDRRRPMYRPTSPRAVGDHAGPVKWVKRYVDYTSKYGLGFMLNDGCSGVYFNDATKAALDRDAFHFQYIERRKTDDEKRVELVVGDHTVDEYPSELNKKVTLLKHFHSYLTEQEKKANAGARVLLSPGAAVADVFSDGLSPKVVYVKKWVRTKHALLFRLSDQTIQVVFYDQTEVLLTPDDRYITYVDKKNQQRKTYNFTDELVGSFGELEKRLKYTKEILEQLVAQSSSSSSHSIASSSRR